MTVGHLACKWVVWKAVWRGALMAAMKELRLAVELAVLLVWRMGGSSVEQLGKSTVVWKVVLTVDLMAESLVAVKVEKWAGSLVYWLVGTMVDTRVELTVAWMVFSMVVKKVERKALW